MPQSYRVFSRFLVGLGVILVTDVAMVHAASPNAPHVVVIGGDAEYGSRQTTSEIEKTLRDRFGFRTTLIHSHVGVLEGQDNPDKSIPNLEVIQNADLLIIFVRMRIPPPEQLALLHRYFEDGKPAIAIRTTTHGFTNDRGWCPRYFGGHYWSHFGGTTETFTLPAMRRHPVLRGVEQSRVHQHNSLYITNPLSDKATPLVLGRMSDETPAQAFAWIHEYRPGSRQFCFTASHPQDIAEPDNQALLYNAVFWTLKLDVPEGGVWEHFAGRLAPERPSPELQQGELPSPPRLTAPDDAVVLFDGQDLSRWDTWFGAKQPRAFGLDGRAHSGAGLPEFDGARWPVVDGTTVATPAYGDIITRDEFTDYRLHLDFLIPPSPDGTPPVWRGNSGVFLNGLYEIQLLDSFGAQNDRLCCGAITGQRPPQTNASKAAGSWQSLDVIFRAARFENGRKTSRARATVVLNGETIHDNVEINKATAWGFPEEAERGPLAGPVRLQADCAPVRFANVWLLPLAMGEADQLLPRRRELTGKSWIDMDYGPYLTASLEIEPGNIANKGIAIRLDKGVGGVSAGNEFVLFDTDTLRYAAGWKGPRFINWENIALDGKHVVHADVVGHKVFTNPDAPGWADPKGAFEDQRIVGRDNNRYGPMPHEWARWKGLYLHNDEVVLSYHVGGVDILELPAAEGDVDDHAITRTLNIGPRSRDLIVQVAEHRNGSVQLRPLPIDRSPNNEFALFLEAAKPPDSTVSQQQPASEKKSERKTAGIHFSGNQSVGLAKSAELDMAGADFTIYARLRTEEDGTIFAKSPNTDEWVPNAATFFIHDGRPHYDIGWVGVVESDVEVSDGDWHDVAMTWRSATGRVQFYVDGKPAGGGRLRPEGELEEAVARIGFTAADFPEPSGFTGEFEEVRFYQKALAAGQLVQGKLPKDDNLVGLWREAKRRAVVDASGHGHDGRLVQSGEGDAESPIVFDGQQVYLEVPTSRTNEPIDHDLTLYARVKTEEGGTIFSLASVEDNWQANDVCWFIRDGRQAFDMGYVGAVAGSIDVDDDQWHDLAMTYDHQTGRVQFFVDGKTDPLEELGVGEQEEDEDGDGAESGDDEDADTSAVLRPLRDAPEELAERIARIGFTREDFPEQDGAPSFFTGQMAELRVYRVAWKPDDIPDLAEDDWEDAEQLLARFDLSASINGIVEDDTGNGFTAHLIGDATAEPTYNTVTCAAVLGGPAGTRWISSEDGHLRLKIPAGNATRIKLVLGQIADPQQVEPFVALVRSLPGPRDLNALTKGGQRRWSEPVTTQAAPLGRQDGAYAVENLTTPMENPYRSWMRLSGFDFFTSRPDRAAVCTWQGDVWLVDGLGGDIDELTWSRIATGMFQPLGLKIVDDVIYVTCRDQLTILRDLNGDGETDFYENFNNDHQVTEHFHEFAVGLQTDDEGNFYYAKCARHALDALVPQHGTLIKVSKDGATSEIIAAGFRAPNGVCVNADGTFIVSDEEGHWTPQNRINWISRRGGFFGNMMAWHEGRHRDDFEQPIVWVHKNVDRSPAEQMWVEGKQWGPLEGALLNLSYGTGHIHVVLFEEVNGAKQAGLVRLPIPDFPTGVMRGRYHPVDGQLYCCGLFGWSSNQTEAGGFYRVRYTGRPLHLPVALNATKQGMAITFSQPLDKESAGDYANYAVSRWTFRRTADYGSDDYSIKNRRKKGRDRVRVENAVVSDDGKTVLLEIRDMQPSPMMEITYRIKAADGSELSQTIQNTIHQLGGG